LSPASAQHKKPGTGKRTSTAGAAATVNKENHCCSTPASKEKKHAIVQATPAGPSPTPVMEDKLLVRPGSNWQIDDGNAKHRSSGSTTISCLPWGWHLCHPFPRRFPSATPITD